MKTSREEHAPRFSTQTADYDETLPVERVHDRVGVRAAGRSGADE